MKLATVLFAFGVTVVVAGALAFRLPRLDKRPMHCDEANQAKRAATLLETGQYRYDPKDHHGPSLYYLTLPALWLAGADDFAHTTEPMFRIVPVVFGVAMVLLLVLVADGIGRPAALVAGVLLAISPAMVFYSRYYIQEMLLVFFTAGAIACGWRWWRSRGVVEAIGWAIATGACVGLMHATKETWVLAAAAATGGLAATALWSRGRDVRSAAVPAANEQARSAAVPAAIAAEETQACGRDTRAPSPLHPAACGRDARAPIRDARALGLSPALAIAALLAVLAAIVVTVLFYSSFGSNWGGPIDSLLAYGGYAERGTEGGLHRNPAWFYLARLAFFRPAKGFFWSEGLIVGLAAVGCLAALSRRGLAEPQRGFCRFLAFYTLLLTALYSAIPYKTPWCMLSFLDGMILLAGVGAWALIRWMPGWTLKIVVAGLLVVGAGQLARQSYFLNYRLDADVRNPYVYAHSSPDVVNLANQLERLAAAAPAGHGMVIHVVTPENFWPLPWYLRRFDPERMGYWQDAQQWVEKTVGQPPPEVIVLTADVQPTVDAHLAAAYNKQMIYGLQPGVLLSVYVREDVWNAFLAAQ
ncbi:MAG: flippase activity-associated protein Agl23 [Pirellulales bacterium]